MGLRFGIKETLSFWGLVDNVAEGERNCVTGGDVFWVMGWWCVIGLSCLHRHERYAFGVYLLFLFLLYRVTEWERERELLLSWSNMGWLGHDWGFWFLTLALVKLTSLWFFLLLFRLGFGLSGPTCVDNICDHPIVSWHVTRVIEAGSSNYRKSWIRLAHVDSFFIIIPCFSTQIIVRFFFPFSIWQ